MPFYNPNNGGPAGKITQYPQLVFLLAFSAQDTTANIILTANGFIYWDAPPDLSIAAQPRLLLDSTLWTARYNGATPGGWDIVATKHLVLSRGGTYTLLDVLPGQTIPHNRVQIIFVKDKIAASNGGTLLGTTTMPPHFTPRLNLHHKPYRHVVALGETPQSIAEKHGAGVSGYRELLAANLPRATKPMGPQSPSGSVTFAFLEEGEELNVPSHWPEPPSIVRALAGIPGMIGVAPVLDTTNPLFVAASQSAHAQFDASLAGDANAEAFLSSVINAAVAWYADENGNGTPVDTLLMDKLVYNAAIWSQVYGIALTPDQAGKFPWGPFRMLLSPNPMAWEDVDWASDGGTTIVASVPRPTGFAPLMVAPPGLSPPATWAWIPWDLVAAQGPQLESLPSVGPVVYPAQVDQAVTRATWQNAISNALAGGPTVIVDCGPNGPLGPGYKNSDPTDNTSPCVSLCADPKQFNPSNATCCPLGSQYDASLGTCNCGAGNYYDTSTGQCVTGTMPVTTDATTPPKSSLVPVLLIGGAAAGALWWFLKNDRTHTPSRT